MEQQLAAADPIRLSEKSPETPELWTSPGGESLFSFVVSINMDTLMQRAGVADLSVLGSPLKMAVWEVQPDDPHVAMQRILERLSFELDGFLSSMCGAQLNGGSCGGRFREDRTNCYNVPAEYALAMADLFREGGLRVRLDDGFVDPSRNLPLRELEGGLPPPRNLAEFMRCLNQIAFDAVDRRNERVTPRDEGSQPLDELKAPFV